MSDVTSTELAIPTTGELVNLEDPKACAKAISYIRFIEGEFRDAKAIYSRAIAHAAAIHGTRTIELDDGRKVHVSSGSETQYDAEAIMEGLAAAGMPQERISEIVEETVVYKVRAVEAKRAAAANAAYATVIDDNSREVEKPVTVSIRRS